MSQEQERNNTKHQNPPANKGSWLPILGLLALILIATIGYHIITRHGDLFARVSATSAR